MERPIIKPIGTPMEELDTPALVLDLEQLQQNIDKVHSFFEGQTAKLRPHVESHRCPTIAHQQLDAGGTVGGISVTTVGQAEVFAQAGISDIAIANEVVTAQKIVRLCALTHRAKITVAVDSADNVRSLSEAAQAAGVTLNVVVDIHTRLERCGVEPGHPAVDLAKVISQSKGLRFAGLTAYEGTLITDTPEELSTQSKNLIQPVLDTREMVEAAGLEVSVVSVGGTHNYEIAGAMPGVTEVPAGTYALMDHRYSASRPGLKSAAKVMATVTSLPEPGKAILDTGKKATGDDTGFPNIDDFPNVTLAALSAEHGNITWDEGNNPGFSIGQKVWYTPFEIGATVNVYDYMQAVRNGKLETVLEISARGRYR